MTFGVDGTEHHSRNQRHVPLPLQHFLVHLPQVPRCAIMIGEPGRPPHSSPPRAQRTPRRLAWVELGVVFSVQSTHKQPTAPTARNPQPTLSRKNVQKHLSPSLSLSLCSRRLLCAGFAEPTSNPPQDPAAIKRARTRRRWKTPALPQFWVQTGIVAS
jgi:hypothetical protein